MGLLRDSRPGNVDAMTIAHGEEDRQLDHIF